ncbi:hypothetical protein THAOC_01529 [Thalassiosira oceanica]|uniref:HSF-type DNA-binding domain-containing protein n=1 Tax=Thalassiosira oceanica TaxID=159749 RepID=K0TI86_THAOC|nr:hypothetical protein THAOC_01529 [Thalassiosira oceanica]|eukprot:EJK76694.1 hypothetical protein THAOC_01529 [Thalassiosira oceanica]
MDEPTAPFALSEADGIFPVKLHEMLAWADAAMMSHIVSWCPHGRMFRVSDKDAFMKKVSPLFFKSTKFRSFTRQLLLWGFRRETKGPDANAWYHESFRKSMPGLARQLKRTSIKGCKRGERAKAKEPIPNFHAKGPDDMRRRGNRQANQANRRATVSLPMPPTKDGNRHFPNLEEDTNDINTVEIRKPKRRLSDFISSAPTTGGGWQYIYARNVPFLPAPPGIHQHLHDPSLYTGFNSMVPGATLSSATPSYITSAGLPGKIVSSISDFSAAESAGEDVDEFSQFIEKSIHFTHE